MDENEKKNTGEVEERIPEEYKAPFWDHKKVKILLISVAVLLVVGVVVLIAVFGGGKDDVDSAFKNSQYVNPTETTDGTSDNGTGDNTTDDNGGTTTGGNLQEDGANTEGGWGPIITP